MYVVYRSSITVAGITDNLKTRLIISFFMMQQVQLFDTMAGMKKRFVARDNRVRMLLCGPTVYDYMHVGHARMLLSYDLMARYLISRKICVSVVVNITDIDQKIFSKAKAFETTLTELAGLFINELLFDLSSLGIDSFVFARVSDHIRGARQLVARLLKNGDAYSAGGNIYLDTTGKLAFGRMSKMTREDLDNCRLDLSPEKKATSDILLWNANENFDFAFSDAILGRGIPWWHMQDSTVAMAIFGGSYDIHGGASELVYPHHESHFAQLQTITSQDNPVRFWTHVGLVRSKGKKMSKSLRNTIVIRDLLKKYNPNALRLYFYSKHYRDDFDFAEKDIDRFMRIDAMIATSMQESRDDSELNRKFFKHIENDFDSPRALKVLIEAAKAQSSDLGTMVKIFGLRY